MALIACKECEKRVSDSTGKCAHCGVKACRKTSVKTWIAAAVVAFVVLATMSEGMSFPRITGHRV
jgi:hypothetical protein